MLRSSAVTREVVEKIVARVDEYLGEAPADSRQSTADRDDDESASPRLGEAPHRMLYHGEETLYVVLVRASSCVH